MSSHKGLCGACLNVHDSTWTGAVGRFDPNTPTTYRANYPSAANRQTRVGAEADMCAHLRSQND